MRFFTLAPTATAAHGGHENRHRQKANPFGSVLTVSSILIAVSAFFSPALAVNDDLTDDTEHLERQGVDARLKPDEIGLLGDLIDLNTGTLLFETTDISLPGNSRLEVALRRSKSVGGIGGRAGNVLFGGAKWSRWIVEFPVIGMYTPSPPDWSGTWRSDRCTALSNPGVGTAYYGLDPTNPAGTVQPWEYWNGLNLWIPGEGKRTVLDSPSGAQWPAGTSKVTADNWALTCIADIGGANGGGQGFIAIAPNGDRYRFDRLSYGNALYRTPQGDMARKVARLAASEVTDVSGNWVRYTYDSAGRLTKISSNDGRTIAISYAGPVTATANGRTWTYTNTTSTGAVTLPDGRQWTYDFTAFVERPRDEEPCPPPDKTAIVTHPNGIVGHFTVGERNQGRTYVPSSPPRTIGARGIVCGYDPYMKVKHIKTISLLSKTLSGSGYPSATWTYDYSNDLGARVDSGGLPDAKWTRVVDPLGRKTVSYFNRRWGDLEGLLTREEIYATAAATTPMQATDYTYAVESPVGIFDMASENQAMATKPRRTATTIITRGTDTFTTRNTYNTNQSLASYSYGFPVKNERWSSVSPTPRVDDVLYAHNKTRWVLGLPSTVTKNGTLFESYTYDTLGRVTTRSEFGAQRAAYTYHTTSGQQGTIATITDSHQAPNGPHIWSFSSWKRGLPQSILRPDGSSLSRTVDNNGWVASETNGRAATTNYGYNNVGWLTLIDRPTPFADSTFAYSGLGAGVRQTETRGTLETTTWHDSLLRPFREKRASLAGDATTTYSRTDYNALGLVVFQSWPDSILDPVAGVETTYDGLLRVKTIAENVSPYATTTFSYLTGNKTRTVDPAGAVVTTTMSAYGSPDEGDVTRVDDALGMITTTTRDIYGNVQRISQSGTQNGFTTSVARDFWYDGSFRLCRHRAPEFGDEVFVYDTEGLLIESGRGVAAATGCLTSVGTGQRVTRGYDAMHRETSVVFPAGTPGVTRSYDGNSNVTSATRTGGAAWSYIYDALDNLTQETLVVDGRTYVIGHGRTLNGDVTSRSNGGANGSGVSFTFDANAFGQPRRVRVGTTDYVANATYHPNGLFSDADYANGRHLSQSLDARQKPYVLKTGKPGTTGVSAVWLTYGYDARGKISSILDSVNSAETRSFSYDANGRLLTSSGPWGNGSYVYDALGNIRALTEGTVTTTIAYNATKNRVSSAVVGGATRSFTYDVRGNVTDNGPTGFTYDHANQPVTLTGTGAATFAYDANFKRVKEVRGGKTIYTLYSRVTGGLVYRDQATDNVKTDYAAAGGAAVRLVKTGGGAPVPTYVHFDHLGSALAASSASGGILWRESYRPFGEATRTLGAAPANDNDTGFTGHLEDDAAGLVYMQARMYDPAIGRFYSTDPVGYQDQLNLYAYVHNDPVNAFDPNGEAAFFVTRSVIIAGVDTGQSHGFILVTKGDSISGDVVARYSFGPEKEGGAGALSNRTGTGDRTDKDDATTVERIQNGDTRGTTVTQIDASDAAVITAGDAAIGNPQYDPLPGDDISTLGTEARTGVRPSSGSGANSNSAGVAIAKRAAESEGNTFTPPPNVSLPGAQQADRVQFRECVVGSKDGC